MKALRVVVVGMVLAFAQVAEAYVAQVVTTVPVAAAVSAEDPSQLQAVVESAVRDVLAHAIAFTPTVVKIEDARIIGERLYLVLLVADAEGEATIEGLAGGPSAGSESEPPECDREDGSARPGPVRL